MIRPRGCKIPFRRRTKRGKGEFSKTNLAKKPPRAIDSLIHRLPIISNGSNFSTGVFIHLHEGWLVLACTRTTFHMGKIHSRPQPGKNQIHKSSLSLSFFLSILATCTAQRVKKSNFLSLEIECPPPHQSSIFYYLVENGEERKEIVTFISIFIACRLS